MLLLKIRTSFVLLFAPFLPTLAVDSVSGTDASQDAEANLAKSIQGYKVGDPARYRNLFAPLRTEKAALSPDGKLLAYAVLKNDNVHVRVVAVDQPTVIKTDALIHRIERALRDPSIEFGHVDWLCWVTPNRLVISSTALSQTGNMVRGVLHKGVISAIDADGSNARLLATAREFREIAYAESRHTGAIWPIGLLPDKPGSVVFVGYTNILNPRSSLLISRMVNALTGEVTKMGEVFAGPLPMLHDNWGRGRITKVYRTPPDLETPILYQSGDKAKSSVPLDQATGLRGFTLSTATALGESSVPLGFAGSSNTLYYASNVGRTTHGIYGINLNTAERLPPVLEIPGVDLLSPQLGTFESLEELGFGDPLLFKQHLRYWRPSPQLVIDRFTHELAGVRYETTARTAAWLRPELRAVQERLTAERPGRNAEILEWDQSLNRFLVREQSPADAGSFFIFDLTKNIYTDLVRRGAEPEEGSIAQLTSFDFRLPDGSRIDGVLALPKDSKVKKIPLVLLCPDYPWQRRGASYQREFEALTRMGFAVALYNGRGAWGTGLKDRQQLRGDYVGLQVDDVVAVADHLASKFTNVSAKAVALFGQAHGGHVALRTLQLHPQRFRCAVTVDAWLHGMALLDAIVQSKALTGSHEKATRPTPTPLTEQPELIKAPVFTIVPFSQTPRFHANTALHRVVKRNAPDSELFVQTDKLAERSEVLARQWARTESFLNYVLYNFSVKIGELELLPDAVAKPKEP